ncbi:MAG: putative O-glycosylation ligase, exosortase A system-associated [Gammaproteobacteria bacterium]|nr:putative O-glycosylation ligase, exosortase A system-associated [Gammaproteobacteria bacterium]
MRDLFIAAVVFGALPFILKRTYIGVLVWSWIGYMNPHRLAYGFAYSFPWAQVVALATLVSLLINREEKKFPITGLTVVWLLFLVWMGITTVMAAYPDQAFDQLIKVAKIQLITLITVLVMYKPERIQMLVWTIALSIGFYGIKGGVFTIATAGAHRVWGPEGSFIWGNNEIALALLMVLPLFYFMRDMVENKWLRQGLLLCMLLMAVSAIGSQSRGALLAGFSVLFFFWLKSQSKFLTGIAGVTLTVLVFLFMPQSWHDRMGTIQTYQEDRSAMGRISHWEAAVNLANDRLFGGGYDALLRSDMFYRYANDPTYHVDAHSIYFEVLGDHGWIGLALFLLLGYIAFRTAGRLIRVTRGVEELSWVNTLARMLQVSLVAYATGGAFLGLAYFDLFYHIVAILVLLRLHVDTCLAEHDVEPTRREELVY